VHDAAAVRLGGGVYLFGGGTGTAQLDLIIEVDPSTGSTRTVGHLPEPSSDQAAAALGGTAYVVGGYTGTAWLNTVVAWRPGRPARVVAHLPTPLRYAAAAAADGRVVIAGGSLPSGGASRAVFSFDAASGAVRRIGSLPGPTTHAAAVALADRAFVIGGRGATLGTPTDRIVAVDPDGAEIQPAGRLAAPLSDLAAATVGDRIVLVGGRDGSTTGWLSALVPWTAARAPAAEDIYANDRQGMMSPAVRGIPERIYVPNSASNTVDVIDPHTYRIVAHYAVGALPQHVTPSYDLKTLYVDNDEGNSLTPIDPTTSRPKGPPIPVADPYNLYFTPSGRYAIVVAERNHRLDFREPHTMRLLRSLPVPCAGVDHMDFSEDGSYAVASCEFSGQLLKIDVRRPRVVAVVRLGHARPMPQDVKVSPDGKVFYVADMSSNGVWKIDGARFRVVGFIPTGRGAHGLYPSRDAKLLYVTNRDEGSISRISFATEKVVGKWWTGGSPDMGGVSPDGKVLWLSQRYDAMIYAISTKSGRVLAKIRVGDEPHGLCVWPQPGRYSIGHTGNLR
jgi:YVTN family beta-propeller protein